LSPKGSLEWRFVAKRRESRYNVAVADGIVRTGSGGPAREKGGGSVRPLSTRS
jgi:hypothetical protein